MGKSRRGSPQEPNQPNVVVLAGPNGAGKSTAAPLLLKGLMEIDHFVNSDVIAQGLSGFSPEAVALEAAAIMLRRIRSLAAARRDFAFETTLASRSLAPWLRQMLTSGYRVHLVFLWLSSDDLAVQRVTERVRLGGHAVPETTIRRRYQAALRNFFRMYRPLATTWRFYDNSAAATPQLIASGQYDHIIEVVDPQTWQRVQEMGQ